MFRIAPFIEFMEVSIKIHRIQTIDASASSRITIRIKRISICV